MVIAEAENADRFQMKSVIAFVKIPRLAWFDAKWSDEQMDLF